MFGRKRKTPCYGLQILDSQAKIVELVLSQQRVRVTKLHTASFSGELVKNGKILDEDAVAKQLKTHVAQLGIAGAQVHLTIPTSSIVLRRSVFAALKDRELRNLIDVELYGEGQLPFKNPVFDFIRLGEVKPAQPREDAAGKKSGVADKKEEVLIFATPQEVVDSYVNVVKAADLQPVAVDLAPLALYRLLVRSMKLAGEFPAKRFMLLLAESDYAEISIFADGIPVFLRALPVNAYSVLDADGDKTEVYSRNLAMELSRVINYYKYSVAGDQEDIKDLYLLGERELAEKLPAYLEDVCPGTVRKLPIGSLLLNEEQFYHSYAVPIGLAMKGA